METSLIVSTSAPALQAGLDSGGSFGWLWHARTVLASERSTACPGPMPVTPKVARHLRASMVGQLGAGLASFCFHLQPQLDQTQMATAAEPVAHRNAAATVGGGPEAILQRQLFTFNPSSTSRRMA